MTTVREWLRQADPLLHEPLPVDQHDRRRAALMAAAQADAPSTSRSRSRLAVSGTVALAVILTLLVAFRIWWPGAVALQAAAVRFEVRLAETSPAAGLREATIQGDTRSVFLHEEVIVTNSDIARARLVPDNAPSRFGIEVEFNAEGAQKMRAATAGHLGKPIAVLIDGEVVIAPTLRAPISTSAVITGHITRDSAERIVNGIIGQ